VHITNSVARWLPLASAGVVMCSSWMFSQNPQVQLSTARRFPTVVFTSVLWSADPSYYSIAIDSSGVATYLSAPSSLEKTGVPYTIEFQATDRTRRLTFNLARSLDFFAGESAEPAVSPEKISIRTLAYTDEHLNNQLTYAAPSGPDLEEITSVFEQLSETLECGRRLAYLQQQHPEAVGSELQGLQNLLDRRQVREFQALVPLLRVIASDQRIDASTHKLAETLLQLAQRWR
jgi:hypothetical protein